MTSDGYLALVPLGVVFLVSVVVFVARPLSEPDAEASSRLARLFLLGLALQCFHFLEEYRTGLYVRMPELLGLQPLTAEFFVTANSVALGIWILSAAVILKGGDGVELAYLPVWFFALAECLNLVIHPLLAIWAGGYFPGLVTSPVVGVVGVILTRKLWAMSR